MVSIAIALVGGLAVALASLGALQIVAHKDRRAQARVALLGPAASGGQPCPHTSPALRLAAMLPFMAQALKKRQKARLQHQYEAELPRLLDLLAMGMGAGLGFDAALGLYVQRFDTELALLIRERFEVWERGLISRDEGLKELISVVELPLFERFCKTASRSIRHGIPLVPLIKEYAIEARREYRDKQKEQVLKAPVKMLIPTGALILPAMLMLVIGPILLDVTERMG